MSKNFLICFRNLAVYVGKKWEYCDKMFPFNFWHFGEISHPIKTLVGTDHLSCCWFVLFYCWKVRAFEFSSWGRLISMCCFWKPATICHCGTEVNCWLFGVSDHAWRTHDSLRFQTCALQERSWSKWLFTCFKWIENGLVTGVLEDPLSPHSLTVRIWGLKCLRARAQGFHRQDKSLLLQQPVQAPPSNARTQQISSLQSPDSRLEHIYLLHPLTHQRLPKFS